MRRLRNATVAAQDNEQNAQLDNMMIKMSPRDRQSEGLLARAYDSRVENATNRIRLRQERPNWEPSMIAHNDELSCATDAKPLAEVHSTPILSRFRRHIAQRQLQ